MKFYGWIPVSWFINYATILLFFVCAVEILPMPPNLLWFFSFIFFMSSKPNSRYVCWFICSTCSVPCPGVQTVCIKSDFRLLEKHIHGIHWDHWDRFQQTLPLVLIGLRVLETYILNKKLGVKAWDILKVLLIKTHYSFICGTKYLSCCVWLLPHWILYSVTSCWLMKAKDVLDLTRSWGQ